MGCEARAMELPSRRLCISAVVDWNRQEWLLGIGFDRSGRAVEAFAKGTKSGQHLDALADDCCIVLSKLLQRGEKVQDLIASLFAIGAGTGRAEPSLLAKIVQAAARIEREEQAAIQMAYECAERKR